MNLNTPFTVSFSAAKQSWSMKRRAQQWEQRQRFWEAVKQCRNREELKTVLSSKDKDQ